MSVYHGYDFSDWIHPRACKTCGFITCKCRAVGIDRVSICQDDEDDWYVEFYLDDVRHGYMLKEVAEAMGGRTLHEMEDLGESPTETRTLTDF